ncbi:MAG: undecaprenyl-diphosphate phosphatase [Candidatus Diapherotrites archaeon]
MDAFQALVFGVLQGIFEWLPISSQGQVMNFTIAFFNINADEAFRIASTLHIGTLFSALIYFRKDVWEILSFRETRMLKFLLVAVFSTALTAFPCYYLLKILVTQQENRVVMIVTSLLLVLMGALLIIVGRFKVVRSKKPLTEKSAFITGLAQGLSILPGISRSGITVSALLLQGYDAESSFKTSFILSIPTVIFGEMILLFFEPVAIETVTFVGILSAFFVGLASIGLLMKIAKKVNFGKICIMFGVLYFLIVLIDLNLLF